MRKLYIEEVAAILDNIVRKLLKQQQFFLLTALEIREQSPFGEDDIFMLVISCQKDNWEIVGYKSGSLATRTYPRMGEKFV